MTEDQIPDRNSTETSSDVPEASNIGTITNPGIVYVLENPGMAGYIKLGKTDNLIRRMRDLFDTRCRSPLPATTPPG